MRRFWPVRKYPWGTCEAMSSRHSDLAALKKLLFEVGLRYCAQDHISICCLTDTRSKLNAVARIFAETEASRDCGLLHSILEAFFPKSNELLHGRPC